LKTDLREDQNVLEKLKLKGEHPVTEKEALALAAKLGAVCYVECSALHQFNLDLVFDNCIRIGANQRPLGVKKTRRQRTGGCIQM